MQPSDLSGMALFVRIVEAGSLSAAGRVTGLPKATVSRRLVLLERQAGRPLLARSTRSIALTDAGRRYYERVRLIVQEAEAAQAELTAGNAEPSGLLRISASVTYGPLVIAPRVVAFAARYPRVRIDLSFSEERVHLIAERFDLAIRMGPMEDSDLLSRRLADMPLVIVAAPAYLERRPPPNTATDLADHDAIVGRPDLDHWQVGDETVRVRWRMNAGSLSATRLALLAGLGIARVPQFVAADALASGALVRLLPDLPLPPVSATAVYPRATTPSPALKALLEELKTLPAPDCSAP